MTSSAFASDEKGSEYERLSLIQDSFDDKSQKHILKAGLRKGMACLEIGVGTGSIASWMCEEVGSEGSVLGVEVSAEHVDDSRDFELLEGDLLDLDLDRKFDLIHIRYVLCLLYTSPSPRDG